MTYYILEPKEEFAEGYFYANADTDKEAEDLAKEERPELSFKILGTLKDLKSMIDEGYPKAHDTVVEK